MSALTLPIHVEEHGSGKRTIVLVHGFGGNGYTWRYWVSRLARSHRVLVVDLKGHGAAPKPDDDAYSPFDHADLLVRVIRGRGVERATLVGHSLGGGIVMITALELLEKEPDRLESLVLISAATRPQAIPRFIRCARMPLLGRALLGLVPPRVLVRRVLRTIVHDPSAVTEDQVEAYAEPLMSKEGRRAIRIGARQIMPEDAARAVDRYPSIELPALLLWGAGDRVVPVGLGHELDRVLTGARLEVLDACGHIPQEELPRRSLELVLAFLDELNSPP